MDESLFQNSTNKVISSMQCQSLLVMKTSMNLQPPPPPPPILLPLSLSPYPPSPLHLQPPLPLNSPPSPITPHATFSSSTHSQSQLTMILLIEQRSRSGQEDLHQIRHTSDDTEGAQHGLLSNVSVRRLHQLLDLAGQVARHFG